MDASAIATTIVSSVVVSTALSTVVAWRMDQRKLNFEREKWEHEKGADARKDARQTCNDVIKYLEDAMAEVSSIHRFPPGSVHFTTHYASVSTRLGDISQRVLTLMVSVDALNGVIGDDQVKVLIKGLSESVTTFNTYMRQAQDGQLEELTYGKFYAANMAAVGTFKTALGSIK